MEKFILHGRLGRDPEMRYTPEGTAVTEFSLAVDKSYKRPDGSKVELTAWYTITSWRGLAEFINKWARKGARVIVYADKAESDAWIDKATGEAKSKIKLTAREVELIDWPESNNTYNTPTGGGNDFPF